MRHLGFCRSVSLGAFCALVMWLCLLGSARAQTPAPLQSAPAASSADTLCPPGNLLARRIPGAYLSIRRDLALLTDGAVGPEGAIWDAPLATLFETAASSVTWDLGAVIPLDSAYIQADGNDTYNFFGSVDGQQWKSLGTVSTVEGHGLKGRKVSLGRVPVRFLRFGEGAGDGFFSVSEVQAFCQSPSGLPPDLKVQQVPVYVAPTTIYTYWNDASSARWEMTMALLGAILLHLGTIFRKQGRPEYFKKARDRILAVLGVLAALTYINFGFFHFGNYLHNWEWFHYYTGAKYSQELGYGRLYECTAIADAEDGLLRRVEKRKMTDLKTNLLVTSDDILKHPERCKNNFSAERWTAFKKDIAFFRSREGAQRWDDSQTDHGYNGTPVWNIAGSVLANLAPASLTQIVALSLFDQAFYVGMMGMIWWAFGWRVLSVGMMAFSANFPSRFYWTGGAFLRWDWLFFMIASLCLLRKQKPLAAGITLAYSTLLRIFPGLIFSGPVLAAGYGLYKNRRLDPVWLRFFGGAAIAVAVLVPISLKTSGGPSAYVEFVKNTIKHKETPLTNYMGLRTVLAYRPKEAGRFLKNNDHTDPWDDWKSSRLRSFQQAKPLFFALVLGYLVLMGYVVRRHEPWVAAALGVTMIAIGAELTCYYYAFIIGVALLHEKNEAVGKVVLLVTAITQFQGWAPLPRMATWIDEQYTAMSAATVLAFGLVAWLLYKQQDEVAAAAPIPAAAPPLAVVAPAPEKKTKRRR